MWTKKRLLIWGKTYPEFSKSYYETVCTGAIDGESGKLVRIYPITLRYMKEAFKKYEWIEAEVQRNGSDFRPESFRVRQELISVVERESPRPNWPRRVETVLRAGNVFASLEELLAAEERDHTSLGLVKPRDVRFYARRRSDAEKQEWLEKREESICQKELFVDAESKTKDLEFPSVRFYAEFRCEDAACKGHNLSVLDWEPYVLLRKMRREGRRNPQGDVIEQLEKLTDPSRFEVHFFLGNMMAHCKSFSIVGLFCPPKRLFQRELGASQMDMFSRNSKV